MKLLSISFKAVPRMPGVRASELATIKPDKPGDALHGWRVSLRGQQVFFISPPGWLRDQNIRQRDLNGPVTVFEVSRADVYFEWEGSAAELETLFKGGKWESPPFGPPPPAIDPTRPLLEQVPTAQIGDA